MKNLFEGRIKAPGWKFPEINIPVLLILKIIFTSLLVLFGITGIVLAFRNPMEVIQPYLPTCLDYGLWVGCWIDAALVSTNEIIETLNANRIYTLAASLMLLMLGILQPEMRMRITSIPGGLVRGYRRIAIWQNWVFQKVEFLNGESARWRRTFNVLKSPYSLLRAAGLSPQLAITMLSIGSVAGGTAVASETVFADRCFSCGDFGEYMAPNDKPVDKEYSDNTLYIKLGAIPVRAITIQNASFNAHTDSALPQGKTEVLLVSGNPAVAASGDTPAFAKTRIEIGELIFSRNRCKELIVEDVDAHTVVVTDNLADGLSVSMATGATSRNRSIITGHHSADEMSAQAGEYDRLWIDAASSGVNGKIGTLTLTGLVTRAGTCVLKNLDIGTLTISQNEVGHDQKLDTKDMQIKSTVTGYKWTVDGNTEEKLTEPAAQ